MKVTKLVEFSEEVEVDVDIEDICAAIVVGKDSLVEVLKSFSNFVIFAESIPDSMIEQFSEQHRGVIASRLKGVVDRIAGQQPGAQEGRPMERYYYNSALAVLALSTIAFHQPSLGETFAALTLQVLYGYLMVLSVKEK